MIMLYFAYLKPLDRRKKYGIFQTQYFLTVTVAKTRAANAPRSDVRQKA